MRLNVSNVKIPADVRQTDERIINATAKLLRIREGDISDIEIIKKSIDARNKDDIRFVYSLDCDVLHGDKILKSSRLKNVSALSRKVYEIPEGSYKGRPVIIGAGPAGLFCAYVCVLSGLKPIMVERGSKVSDRAKDIEEFWKSGVLKPDSNVQFGEGGAGTFSDGKLNTLINDKSGRCRFVLETFVRFGAPGNILFDAKPHVGTDILRTVISNIRAFLLENGADILFNTCVTDILIKNGKVYGVEIKNSEGISEIFTDRVVLAIGHSARDTFKMLQEKNVSISPKPFAVGFRVEHPQKFIDISQYGVHGAEFLPPAPYKLTSKVNERGVYSFCMCPGGYVVNASSEEGMLAVNGMSYSKRDGENSNSAIIVTVDPKDFGSDDALSGVEFQRTIERRAYEAGKGAIPVQSLGEFADCLGEKDYEGSYEYGRIGDTYESLLENIDPVCKGGFFKTDITGILPNELNRCIVDGMKSFDKKIRGFAHPNVLLSGIESRTSSPVKIHRDDLGESLNVRGLYPCGEGAGYAGGITSAAMDGISTAEKIVMS
ncbi:MAG: FAD-dependent oxidoreductase [Lachnospiraceae bacterium]|nr:FAD-dependent oxidoreductase [Lachnospiraceae bacterium]